MIDASIVHLYVNGMSLTQLSKLTQTSVYILKKELIALEVYIRSRDEQNKYSPQNQRQYKINDDYFREQTQIGAYLLGFYAADGCVYQKDNAIKLTLASVDKDFLLAIKKELGAEAPVQDYETKDGYLNSTLKFSSYQIKQDFARFNIIPNKTYNYHFPQVLKLEYYKDFIRGYFDGDGSVSTAGPSAIRWQLCSHEKDILQHVIQFFIQHGIAAVSIQKYKDKELYYIQYSTEAAKQIYSILYYENCWCLSRKREKFEFLM